MIELKQKGLAQLGLKSKYRPLFKSNYNIAPTQKIPFVYEEDNKRQAALLRWGLIPSWSKEEKIGYRLINARAESVRVSPAFRSAFKHRRGLVPASGFFEWQKKGKAKVPYAITMKSGEPMALAGLWESWRHSSGKVIRTFTIITTEANDLIEKVHDRMPVILMPDQYDDWLNLANEQPERLLGSLAGKYLRMYKVSDYVNSAKHTGPQCIKPV